jgi:hypothetical protein
MVLCRCARAGKQRGEPEMAEAIFGIQLIPLNEGLAYRAIREAAQIRATELRAAASQKATLTARCLVRYLIGL